MKEFFSGYSSMRIRNAVIVIMIVFGCGLLGFGQNQPSSNENSRKLIRKVEPRYPELARKMNLGGTVKIVAVIAPDGSVKKMEAEGGSPLLVQAAESAITQWKFAPGTESREVVELRFHP